jgi:hypothetical protein
MLCLVPQGIPESPLPFAQSKINIVKVIEPQIRKLSFSNGSPRATQKSYPSVSRGRLSCHPEFRLPTSPLLDYSPKRKSDKDSIKLSRFDDFTSWQIEIFVQEWLFFGLLSKIL